MHKKKLTSGLAVVCGLLFAFNTAQIQQVSASTAFTIPVPTASGTNVSRTARTEIDHSNANRGYVKVRFLENTTASVRVLVTGPDNIQNQYRLSTNSRWEVFPLNAGNGQYTIRVVEQVEGGRNFAVRDNITINVTMVDEFAPFLTPNQYVNFNRNSRATTLAAELVRGSASVIDSVGRIYTWVIENIDYDFDLANRGIASGYVPDVDQVIRRGNGICFHFAALTTAMLRSQGIPTQLVIGYAGTAYHAWISVYSEEYGWINNIIQFSGTDWILMDPTFAATANQSAEVMSFIGDGTNYRPTRFR